MKMIRLGLQWTSLILNGLYPGGHLCVPGVFSHKEACLGCAGGCWMKNKGVRVWFSLFG